MADSAAVARDASATAEHEAAAPEPVNVTADGGVTKVVLREGTGEVPSKHARCLVHYVGRLAGSEDAFIDTKSETTDSEPVQLVAGRDSVQREVGLNLAVAAMRRGELARVRVSSKYGYGDAGSFSFPTVPPKADLEYELELIDWEPADEARERRLLTYEERLEAAERRRVEGNDLFRAGQVEEALTKYRMALAFLDEDLLLQLEGFHLEQAQAVRAPALANIAACQMRTGDYHAAITSCNQALAAQPNNAKALFRRGRSRHLLGQTQAALEDLQRARQLAPSDGGVLQELQAVKANLKEEKRAEGQLFLGYFDKPAAKAALYEEGEEGEEGQAAPAGPATPAPAAGVGPKGTGAACGVEAAPPSGWWDAVVTWLQWLLRTLFPLFFERKVHAA